MGGKMTRKECIQQIADMIQKDPKSPFSDKEALLMAEKSLNIGMEMFLGRVLSKAVKDYEAEDE